MQHVDSGVMSKIFNTDTFGIPQEHEDNDDAAHATSYQAPATEHAKDAIDYSDFNEAVPDDQLFSNKYYQRGMGVLQTKTLPSSRLRVISDDYDEEGEDESVTDIKPEPVSEQPSSSSNIHALNAPPTTSAPPPAPPTQPVDIKELFPAFEHDKVLKFSELFMTKLQPSSKLQPNKRGIILYPITIIIFIITC